MKLMTQHMGEIEYTENEVIYFENGLPGFEMLKSYIITFSSDISFPFHYLQSIEDCDIAFVITDPFLFVENYDFELSDADTIALKLETKVDEDSVVVYTIVTIPETVEETSINIAGPIIINLEKKVGKQIVLGEYSAFKYPIFVKKGE